MQRTANWLKFAPSDADVANGGEVWAAVRTPNDTRGNATMIELTADSAATQRGYEPPALVVLGSVEAITLSSRQGSYNDAKGRDTKKQN